MIILGKYMLYILHCLFLLIFSTKIVLYSSYGNDRVYFVEGSGTLFCGGKSGFWELNSKDILSATQSVVHGGAVSTSPGSLLKTQILESHPHLLNHNLHFNNLLHYLNRPEHLRALWYSAIWWPLGALQAGGLIRSGFSPQIHKNQIVLQ